MITTAQAIVSLRPGSQWNWVGDDYADLEWLDAHTTKPTQEEVDAEIVRLAEQEAIPQQVPMWAVRTVLAAHDIFDEANAAIMVSDNVALKNIWEYGNYAVRSSAAIAELATALGLTDDQVDDFFIKANALSV